MTSDLLQVLYFLDHIAYCGLCIFIKKPTFLHRLRWKPRTKMLRPLFSLWTSILCVFCRTAESKEKKRPNILIILADDVGTGDIPSYWNSSLVEMPNLSRLSQRGVTFTDAHSTPLCSPSRYMLLSGNYQVRNPATRCAASGMQGGTIQ